LLDTDRQRVALSHAVVHHVASHLHLRFK
jgi:hypothetical protein